MNIMIFGYCVALFLTQVELSSKDIEHPLFSKINKFSYVSINKKLSENNRCYSFSSYCKHSLLLFVCLGFLCYSTTKNISITLFIIVIYIIALPLIVYYQTSQQINEEMIGTVFSYAETALMLLREEKTVYDILKDCEESVEYPLKNDIKILNQYIQKTTDIVTGLSEFEKKYHYSIVINVHIVMKHKLIDGIVNQQLLDYLYVSIESYELALQDFLAKWKSNHFLFYLVIGLNGFGIFSLTNFITVQTNSQSLLMLFVLALYYVLNLATIIFFENWCVKNMKLE